MNENAGVTRPKSRRMQSLECSRLLASVLIVFMHCESIHTFNVVMHSLERMAVPFFFMISGYFTYGANETAIRKRFWRLVRIAVSANLLYLLWDGYLEGARDGAAMLARLVDKCSSKALMEMLLINDSPFKGHLWYLNSVILCTAAMWLHACWMEKKTNNYMPLYIVGAFLGAVHIVLSSFATACGITDPYHLYRNALLFGLPIFILGIFLREYNDKVIRVYNLTKMKLIGLFGAGVLLAALQLKGTGKVEMPVGSLVEAIALILLCVMVPEVSKKSGVVSGMISTFGTLSTYIYVTHIAWIDIYNIFLKEYVLHLGETVEAWFYPLAIVGMSLLTGVLYLRIKAVLKRLFGRINAAKF